MLKFNGSERQYNCPKNIAIKEMRKKKNDQTTTQNVMEFGQCLCLWDS
jgi:hypothetical protein